MPSAAGSIQTIPGGRFTAVFHIDGSVFIFAGSLMPNISQFTSKAATLTYTDKQSLSSARTFSGIVGPTIIDFNMDNGPKITGSLDTPVVPAYTVVGNGSWATSG